MLVQVISDLAEVVDLALYFAKTFDYILKWIIVVAYNIKVFQYVLYDFEELSKLVVSTGLVKVLENGVRPLLLVSGCLLLYLLLNNSHLLFDALLGSLLIIAA